MKEGMIHVEQKIWIPPEAGELQLRILVGGHFGIAGHRGCAVTQDVVGKYFTWENMQDDIKAFIGRCLHCASTSGSLSESLVNSCIPLHLMN